MRRSSIIFFLLLVAVGLMGCGNRTELNELGIISATGIDKEQGAWTVTYQTIIPSAMSSGSSGASGGGGSQSTVHTFSTKAKTIREAINFSNLENSRKLYFAHNNVILIGKNAAEQGIEELIDTYFGNTDSRETVKVLIADGKASDLLKMLIPPEYIPGVALVKILEKDDQSGSYFPSVSMFDVALRISSESSAVGIPIISVSGTDGEKLKSIDVFTKTSSESKLKLTGLSVFKGVRSVATLNREESLGVSWLNNQIKGTVLSFEDKNTKNGVKAPSAYRITRAKIKLTPIKGPLHFSVNVKADVSGDLVESTSQENLSKTEGMHHLEQEVEKVIEAQIIEGWDSLQKINVDLINIGNKIHRKYPEDWKTFKKTWPKDMSSMDIKLEVKAEINRPGLFQSSYKKILEP